MARETKVGLLAGLAFIICFAIILANRGRQDLASSELAYLERASRDAIADSTERSRSPTNGHRAPKAVRSNGRAVPSGPRAGVSRAVPPRTDGGRAAVSSPTPSESQVAAVGQPHRGRAPAFESREHVLHGRRDSSQASAGGNAAARVRVLEERLDELSKELRLSGRSEDGSREPSVTDAAEVAAAPPAASSQQPRSVSAASIRYTVVSGDTLSAIAAAHYGNRSLSLLEAIFDANRATLSSPDRLRVGMELVLPSVPGHEKPVAVRPASKPEKVPTEDKARRAKSTPTRQFRWYQIQKNDRYISIARKQLGDAGRWREIYELNKATFPDSGLIREGVRIKLPPANSAKTRQGRGR